MNRTTSFAALGIFGGPTMVLPAALAAAVWPEMLNDFFSRSMSDRERLRSGVAAAFALDQIMKRLDSGESLRDDGFFAPRDGDRSPAEEVLEGVLLKSRGEHEERKVRILGNIYANLAFSPGCSANEANHLLMTVERLTYRQACILALIARADLPDAPRLRDADYGDGIAKQLPTEAVSTLVETFDLYQRQLILAPVGGTEWDRDDAACTTLLEWPQINPYQLRLTRVGRFFVEMMGLDLVVPPADARLVISHLS